MSDVWERKFQMVDASPLLDPDLDGQNNLLESIAGTDPNDIASVLTIEHTEYKSNSVLVTWQSTLGQRYQLQKSYDLLGGGWVDEGDVSVGTGEMMVTAGDQVGDLKCFYRVAAISDQSTLIQSAEASISHDTDRDGQSDISEIKLGYNPFDNLSNWQAPRISFGSGVVISWNSVKGKRYRLESRSAVSGSEWEFDGELHSGTGDLVSTISVRPDSGQRHYSIRVEDVDSDGDGLTDYEELQVGLDPKRTKTDTLGQGDWQALQALLTADNLVGVKAQAAVANITRMEDGAFELTRTGGLDALVVSYTVSGTAVAGSDYMSLSGSVSMPFGENSVIIPITPLASSTMSLSESVIVTLQDSETYDLGLQDIQQINIIKEVAIDVTDHGAVGDGITDDTLAIQAAIDALEASTTHNTLYFPPGTYRLNQVTIDYETATSSWQILRLGSVDMQGRDIVLSGAVGSKLYSTVSPTRAHMMVVVSSFRSLTARGMTWEKDSNPLSSVIAGKEPSGADGVSLVAKDLRIVEHVNFLDCKFLNCHGALMVTANGYSRRGHLRQLGFFNCELLNPFGSNTINGGQAWGGGQQTYLSQWVQDAVYQDCLFEGGGEDMTDQSTSAGGRLKDAAMIGAPVRLIFRGNTVKRMGVEAVFHTGRQNWISQTNTDVVIPPEDGLTQATVELINILSPFEPGQSIMFRTAAGPSYKGYNNLFRVIFHDPATRMLTFVNDGGPVNQVPGEIIPRNGSIFVVNLPNQELSVIENNLIEGDLPPGADTTAYMAGFTMQTPSVITHNVVKGCAIGIMSYGDYAPYIVARGLLVDSNVILMRDTSTTFSFVVIGVRSWAPDQTISNNVILAPLSKKMYGVVSYGTSANITNNYVIAQKIVRQDYTASERSVGVGIGNTATNTTFENNFTYGFDIGLGPTSPSQSIPHRVISHHSYNDTLPVDPRGVIAE